MYVKMYVVCQVKKNRLPLLQQTELLWEVFCLNILDEILKISGAAPQMKDLKSTQVAKEKPFQQQY